ncbi:MAG: hypothetical protein P8X69_09675 [Maritimibacter sp.]
MFQLEHELAEDFPEYVNRIDELKAENAAFAKLFEEYNSLNHEVVLAETNEHPTEHFHEEEMRGREGRGTA